MMLRSLHPEVNEFEQNEVVKPLPFSRAAALLELLNRWSAILQEQPGQWVKEEAVQMSVTKTALAQWLGDGMLTGAVQVADPDRTTVLDLLRVIDYPNDYVPIVAAKLDTPSGLRVVNKAMLNAQLAKIHIDGMLTSLGLRFGY